MAARMISAFSGHIKEQFQNQRLSFTGGIVIISTSLLNQLLKREIFKCPSSSHDVYGWLFLLCPGLTLAILTLLGSQSLSQALTGICQNDKDVPENAPGGKRKRTWKFIIRKVSIALFFATVAFLSWVIMTLLATDTYVCIKLGPQKERTVLTEKYDMQSKTAGLVLVLVCLISVLIINLAVKCCFSDLPEKELPSMRRYDEMEAKAVNKEFKILMEKSAEARAKDIVNRYLYVSRLQASKQQEISREIRNKTDQGKETDKDEPGIFSRQYVEKLRRFLAVRYPRLDGEEQPIYCRQEEVPESFNEVDGMGQKTTHPICFQEDAFREQLIQSHSTSCV